MADEQPPKIKSGPTDEHAEPGAVPDKPADSKVTAEALSDGTVPTVLQPGETKAPVVKTSAKTGLSSVYRKADITTTVLTFVVGVAVAGLALGGYYFITHNKKTVTPPKTTSLSASDLSKLGGFFSGNSAGGTGQVLTFSSESLFKGRVGINTDLAVTGNTTVSGTTSLGDLSVNKTSTLGITNVRGQLTVAGPVSLQSPAILSAGASITGNLASSGNGSFGGSLSAGVLNAATLSVTGIFNLGGHLSVSGQTPGISTQDGAAAGSIEGNDVTGTVGFNSSSPTGQFIKVNYRSNYTKQPHVLITPANQCTGNLRFYVISTGQFFIIGSDGASSSLGCGSPGSYLFNYWVVQ